MSSSDESIQEQVMALVKATGEKLTDEYYERASTLLCELGFSALTYEMPIPLEIWKGVAQAVADYSGYFVVLHTAVTEPISDQPDPSLCRISGYKEVIRAEPTNFVLETDAT